MASAHNDEAAALPLEVGETLGVYRLTGVLGVGGMGVVYRAEAPSGHPVALKTLRADLGSATAEISPLFLREVRLAARLVHPHLVRALDFGVFDGHTALVMEVVEGVTLTEWARTATQGADVLAVLDDILAALAYAHARGVVHRDLKPANVLVCMSESGRPTARLMDFGVAHVRRTMGGGPDSEFATAGTPEYMAPEQGSLGGEVTPASDLYSFGVLLYEVLSGALPFRGEGASEVLMAHLRIPAPAVVLRKGWNGSAAWSELVASLLEKSPEERPETAGEVRDRLTSLNLRIGEETFAGTWGRDPDRMQREVAAIRGWTAAERTRVLGVRHHGLVPLSEPPFVGRDEELDSLRRVAETVRAQGGTQVVLIEGASGSGKSRLLREFREELERDARFAVWSGEEQQAGGDGESGVRAALRDGLRLSAGGSTLDAARLRRQLAKVYALEDRYQQVISDLLHLRGLPAEAMDYGRQEGVRHLALDRLLNAAAQRRPVCMLVDGAQHGDGFVFRLYQRLLGLPSPACPRVLIAAYEPLTGGRAFGASWRALINGLDAAQVTVLQMAPMPPVLIRDALLGAADVGTGVAEWLARETHGDLSLAFDLLVQLSVEGVDDASELQQRFGNALVPVAVSRFRVRLRELVRSAGVAPASPEVWERFAFFGGPFPEHFVEAFEGLDPAVTHRAIDDGLRTHLLVDDPPGFLRFRQPHHVTALQAIAEEEGRREEGYRAVALVRAQLSMPGRDADAMQAARDFREAGAWREAAAQFEVTGEALDQAGRFRQSMHAWRELSELASHPELAKVGALHRALRGLARASLRAGELDVARDAAERCLGLDAMEEEGIGEALWVSAEVLRERGRLEEALEYSTRAWAVFESLDDRRGMAQVALGRGLIAWRGGAISASEQWLRQALQLWEHVEEPAGEAATFLSLARVGMLTGLADESSGWIEKASHRFRRLHDAVGDEQCRLLRARLALVQGKPETVEEELLDIYSTFSSMQIPHLAAEALLARGHACVELGHWADAEDALQMCAEEFATLGDQVSEAVALFGLALCAAEAGRWETCEEIVQEAMAKDARATSVDLTLLAFVDRLARQALFAGNEALALGLLEQVVDRAERVAEGSELHDRVEELHYLIAELRTAKS